MRFVRVLRRSLLVVVAGCLLLPVAASAVSWRWPLAGTPLVARGFDPPPVPWAAGHRGVDLRGTVGAAVLAAGSGVVGYAGVLAGRGVVAVHHEGGLETTYEPLSVVVHEGEHVGIGAILGYLRPGHGDCGIGFVCLHWGLRRGDDYLDPRQLLRLGPIRLLPVWRGLPGQPAIAQTELDGAEPEPAQRAAGPSVGLAAGAASAAAVAGAAALVSGRRRRNAPT
jgi:hypothetical protein